MSSQRQLVKNSSAYFVGHLIAMTSGLVSMPILTRILMKEDYGMLVLINITLSLIGLIAGLGIQDAVMRFYSTYDGESDAEKTHPDETDSQKVSQIGRFRNTALTFCVSVNGAAVLLLILGSYLAEFFIEQGPLIVYLRVASILVILRATIDIYLAFYRAEGKAWHYSMTIILQQYLSIFFSVIFALYLFKGLWGIYIGMLLGEGIVVVLFLVLLFHGKMVKKPEWEWESVRSILQYGGPLLIANISMLIMNLGDRYVIKYYLDIEAVADYSVPYQLALQVTTILFGPVRQMFFPYIFSL
jgi:O-antigen/teichoic acid export membrane protein